MPDYSQPPNYRGSYGGHPPSQANAPYLPPYSSQYPHLHQDDPQPNQPQYTQNYEMNGSAYGFNQALPAFNAPAATVPHQLPIFQGWNQDPGHLPPYTTPAPPNPAYGPGHNQNYSNYSQQYPPPMQQHTFQQNTLASKVYDNREVSDGDYDPAYQGVITAPGNYAATQYSTNKGNAYMTTTHQNPYPPEASQTLSTPVHELNNGQGSRRHNGGSFPPPTIFANEENNSSRFTTNRHHSAHASAQVSHGEKSSLPKNPLAAISTTKIGNGVLSRIQSPKEQEQVLSATTTLPIVPALVPNPTPYKTIYEARKAGEGAVLNLWSRQIGYRNIIEATEVREEILIPLYDDLKLSRDSPKPLNGSVSADGFSEYPNEVKALPAESAEDLAGTSYHLETRQSTVNNSIAKIAIKSSVPSQIEKPDPVLASPTTTSKPVATIEKERTLQLKMEALRKSREERAQKAMAKSQGVTSIAPLSQAVPKITPTSEVVTSELTTAATASSILNGASAPAETESTPLDIPTSRPIVHQRAKISLPPRPILVQPAEQPVEKVEPVQKLPVQIVPAPLSLVAAPQSAIPGLFMNQRKRPVAADFDTPNTTVPAKRLFGHDRSDTPLVINVSEDEAESDDDDVEMELDSPGGADSPPPSGTTSQGKVVTPPPAAAPLIPGIASAHQPVRLSNTDQVKQKEMEIEIMRRKIAEAEAAKAQKKAQRIASGANTPRQVEASGLLVKGSNEDLVKSVVPNSTAEKFQAAVQIQKDIDEAAGKVTSDQKRIVEAHAAESEKAADLKRQELENRRQRRQAIATDIPRFDAEVKEKQRKLEELRATIAQMEADMQETLENKRKMAEEMETLGQEAEEQLQAEKEELNTLIDMESGDISNSSLADKPESLSSAAEQNEPTPLDSSDAKYLACDVENSPSSLDVVNNPEPQLVEVIEPKDTENNTQPLKDTITPDQTLEAALQEAVRAEADSGESDRMDDEAFYLSESNQVLPITSAGSPEIVEPRSPSYSPQTEQYVAAVPEATMHLEESRSATPESIVPKVMNQAMDDIRKSTQSLDQQDGESEDYEPADATSPIDVSPPFSPAPPQELVSNGVSIQEEEVRDEGEISDEDQEVLMTNGEDPVSYRSDLANSEKEDNQSEPQTVSPTENDIVAENNLPPASDQPPLLTQDSDVGKPRPRLSFTPYESPLKLFHKYRFHPDYERDVSGGYRSLTYSHKIDSDKQFCPWELGGACNDSTCYYQHFRDIGLPDDAILSAIGSPDEFTGEQRKLFCDGLKEVLASLRVRDVSDLENIAHEIVGHRAKFLGDKSKVVI